MAVGALLFFCVLVSLASVSKSGSPVPRDKLWRRQWHHGPHSALGPQGHHNFSIPTFLAAYEFLLPPEQLKRGLAYYGSGYRLRKLIHKLVLGKGTVSVGLVGGSISAGNFASVVGFNDWFSTFSRFMTASFPNTTLTFRNGAVPGTRSDYGVMCMEMAVDPHADLVFIEYNLNDGAAGCANNWQNDQLLNTERLVRRLMDLPGKPAVVLMQVPPHGGAADPPKPDSAREYRLFFETDEDLKGGLAQYYDQPYLSLRSAMHRLAVTNRQPPFTWPEAFADLIHPGDIGHKVMADLAAYMVQQAALDLWLEPFNTAHSYDHTLVTEPLPPPMYPGNLPPNASMCVMEEPFKALVTHSEGWTWVQEGTAFKPKKGFASNTTGTKLRFPVDTQRSKEGYVPVHVAYLKSYDNIGMAQIRCVAGCECSSSTIDGYHTDKVSLLFFHSLLVTQSPQCVLEVEVLNETHTKSNKFKVAGVVVSEHAVANQREALFKDPFSVIANAKQSVTLMDWVADKSGSDVRTMENLMNSGPINSGRRIRRVLQQWWSGLSSWGRSRKSREGSRSGDVTDT